MVSNYVLHYIITHPVYYFKPLKLDCVVNNVVSYSHIVIVIPYWMYLIMWGKPALCSYEMNVSAIFDSPLIWPSTSEKFSRCCWCVHWEDSSYRLTIHCLDRLLTWTYHLQLLITPSWEWHIYINKPIIQKHSPFFLPNMNIFLLWIIGLSLDLLHYASRLAGIVSDVVVSVEQSITSIGDPLWHFSSIIWIYRPIYDTISWEMAHPSSADSKRPILACYVYTI